MPANPRRGRGRSGGAPPGQTPKSSAGNAAGASSEHLDTTQKEQAAEHTSPQAIVIHEVVREEGETELQRSGTALAWSALAAGLSMGFSLLTLALLQARLPATPWADIISACGYTVGFIIVIMGRQQLFTESTLTAMLPLFVHRDRATFVKVMRLWAIVLIANLVGTALVARLLSLPGVFDPEVYHAMRVLGTGIVNGANVPAFVRAIFAGWLIALMVWVLPSARSARLFVILFFTFVVGLGHFPHIVAGSVEAAFAVYAGDATLGSCFTGFLLPTLIGNTIGGVALAALLNHAPLAEELS
jgi:formate/nitrite transporter FocA (FNT family)